MKNGRNDNCPCGSGLKYKKCCGLKEADERVGNRLFRELESSLIEDMLPFADQTFGKEAVDQALRLFLDTDEKVEYDEDDPLNPFFLPWFVFNWMLEEGDDLPSPDAPLNKTIAEAFLEANQGKLPRESQELLRAANRRPLSLFEIQDAVPGKRMKLMDLLQQKIVEVEEDQASTSLRKGEIIIASTVLSPDGKTRPLMIGPFALNAREKGRVIELRKDMLVATNEKEVSEMMLVHREAFVIGLYLDVLDEMVEEGEED